MNAASLNDVIPRRRPDADHGGSVRPVQVKVEHLNKTFKRHKESVHVLRDVSVEIQKGELLVLLGPSGCGKTTLLRCLVGLERPDGGSIQLGGKTVLDARAKIFVQPNRRDVSMVFQNYALWPHMKVAKNVAFPLKARALKDKIRDGRVEEVLRVVQCDHLADRFPPELSGGQQQRVSLARALAPEPALLLLDEPLSNLDALLRIELRAQLRALHRRIGFTGVYVTHDQEEAMALGDRIAVMKEGQIEQIGTPDEVYNFPSSEYVADFLGARNTMTLELGDDGSALIDGVTVQGAVRAGRSGRFVLRARDSHLRLRPAGSGETDDTAWWLPGAKVQEVLPTGEHAEYVVDIGGSTMFVRGPAGAGCPGPGDVVDIGIDVARVLAYDSDGTLVKHWATTGS